jgi:DNA (cytosine-5)-methyltransferase 1
MILDLFAGPGGWDEGLRRNGRTDVLGIELDRDACETAILNGHQRHRGDVYGLNPVKVAAGRKIDGVIGSPPCGGLSSGGLGLGRNDLQNVADLLNEIAVAHEDDGPDPRADYLMGWEDLRSPLLAEPLRWALALDVRWLVLEQVKAALGIWEEYATHLTALGWESADYGVLDAADYGVPQDRERAVLVAHRYASVRLPEPTHIGRHVAASSVVGPGEIGFPRRNDRPDDPGEYRARDMRTTDLPAFTITEKARSWSVVLPGPAGQKRQLSEPEAAGLQSFPPEFVWTGATRSGRFLQIGNAVPPTLAQAVTAAVLEADLPYNDNTSHHHTDRTEPK